MGSDWNGDAEGAIGFPDSGQSQRARRNRGDGCASRGEIDHMSSPINTHSARSAMNRDPDLRDWVEQWLKDKERISNPQMTSEEFEKHWRYVRPEKMHEGAIEAVTAYMERNGAR